jgi:hypothetical protein
MGLDAARRAMKSHRSNPTFHDPGASWAGSPLLLSNTRAVGQERTRNRNCRFVRAARPNNPSQFKSAVRVTNAGLCDQAMVGNRPPEARRRRRLEFVPKKLDGRRRLPATTSPALSITVFSAHECIVRRFRPRAAQIHKT